MALEILAIDPGVSHTGLARLKWQDRFPWLRRIWTVKGIGYGPDGGAILAEEVRRARRVNNWDVEVVVEVPTCKHIHGKVGQRPNTLPLLRLYNLVLHLTLELSGECAMHFVESHDWNRSWKHNNRQAGDKEKRVQFHTIWPHMEGKRSNAHERDAALLGRWWLMDNDLKTRIE